MYLLIATEATIDATIVTEGEGSEAIVQTVSASQDQKKVSGKIHGLLQADNSAISIQMLSLLGQDACIMLNGGVEITPGIAKVSAHLHQDNLILGEKVRVHTLPMLDVHANDVSASHGARIHTIDKYKTFYMMAKGLTEKQAHQLIIDGYINDAFARF